MRSIDRDSLSSGRPLRHLDFPTHPNRQTPGHTNQGESSKHARHFLYILYQSEGRFPKLTPVRSQTTHSQSSTLDAGDTNCSMMPRQWDTPDETRPLPKSLTITGGLECERGSPNTLRDAPYANRTKMLPIANAPHYTTYPPWKMHSHSNR